ncbi:MAG: nucleotide exchange factor GrpE [Proteobacteria bacterium]|nr:nucleotide exchange factor GrpE [Pseudomonadota bacterium]
MSESTAENLPEENSAEAARIRELEAQLAEVKNEALRHLAEAENTRKRGAKEREDTAKYAVSGFAREMLEVADNLHRAIAAVKPEMLDNPGVKALFTGVEATDRQLQSALERAGIKKIEPLGQKFDPNLHRVMIEVDAPDKEPGTVVQVMQPGYMIHDRLLREAMVAIAKGGTSGSVDKKI